jgi:hypothetical protein
MRLDVMSRMRGVADFDELWSRRRTFEERSGSTDDRQRTENRDPWLKNAWLQYHYGIFSHTVRLHKLRWSPLFGILFPRVRPQRANALRLSGGFEAKASPCKHDCGQQN